MFISKGHKYTKNIVLCLKVHTILLLQQNLSNTKCLKYAQPIQKRCIFKHYPFQYAVWYQRNTNLNEIWWRLMKIPPKCWCLLQNCFHLTYYQTVKDKVHFHEHHFWISRSWFRLEASFQVKIEKFLLSFLPIFKGHSHIFLLKRHISWKSRGGRLMFSNQKRHHLVKDKLVSNC